MMKSIISATGLFAAAVTAYTAPVGDPTYGSLYTPNGDVPVTTGQTIQVTWDATQSAGTGATVSLVLCNGPSTNCVRQSSAIIEGVPATSAAYTWNVPCDLPLGTKNTASGYGMLIIVDGTGQYQYSTQFSVLKGASCGGSVTTTSASTSSVSTTVSTSVVTSSTSRVTTSGSATATTTTSKASGSSTSIPNSGWVQWSGSVSATTLSTSPAPVVATTTPKTTASSVTVASVTGSARPSTFTGAAALPTAFVNVFAAVGAAGLAVLAL